MLLFNLYRLFKFIFRIDKKSFFSKAGLTFVGIGPGDPDLLTIAAVNAINRATLVAYPVAKKGGKSIAAEITKRFLRDKRCLPIYFPMVKDYNQLRSAWRLASIQLIEAISKGEEVVLLCQGDPSIYATSAYILIQIKLNDPLFPVKVIPGVTSFSAAAAAAQLPLSLQKEDLLVSPVPNTFDELEDLLDNNLVYPGRVIVLMKLGKRWPWVRDLLYKKDLLKKTTLAKNIGSDDELIVKASEIDTDHIPYFSLLIIREEPNL